MSFKTAGFPPIFPILFLRRNVRKAPGRRRPPCAGLAAALAAVAALASTAAIGAADLVVAFPDGQVEGVPVTAQDGVEYISLQSLTRLLRKVDAGATLEPAPDSLLITVAGSNVSITPAYSVVKDQTLRPHYPLKAVDGELLIPLDTVQEINGILRLFDLKKEGQPPPAATPTPIGSAPALDNVLLPPGEGIPSSQPISPLPGISPLNLTPAPGLPGGGPGSMNPKDVAALISKRPLPGPGSIAVAPLAGGSGAQGEEASAALAAVERAARALRDALGATGRYQCQIPATPFAMENLDKAADWANATGCDAVIAVTMDNSPFRKLSGARIFVAHESMSGPSQMQEASWRGLPQHINFIPFQERSARLAELTGEELAKAGSLKVNPLAIAPSRLLQRIAAPAILISIGYSSNSRDLDTVGKKEFAGAFSQAVTRALERLDEAGGETRDAA